MESLKELLIKKAKQSSCTYRVSAIAYDHKGEVLGTSFSRSFLMKKNGGVHAEELLVARYGKNIKSIAICRVGHSGELRPIVPCQKCSRLLDKYKIKWNTIL